MGYALTSAPALSFQELVHDDLAAVDRVIAERLESSVPLVGEVARYIIGAGGKRLRPVLLLLTAQALGCQRRERHTLAAVVEFIHTATLLHDDVVDESTLRRGRATANETFGNAASVLVGDFLYSRAFQMMVDVGDMRIMRILADATNVIAEGEVLQLMNMHDASLSEESYLQVIRSKTAKLFEASARIGAVLAGADDETERRCATYGQALGTAFQVVDDVLDYTGAPQELGKNLGDDLREGKATLPLIFAMRRASAEHAALVRSAIETGGCDQLDAIVQIVQRTGAIEASMEAARAEALRAAEAAGGLPENAYSQGLLQLATQLLERRH
ncbi:MAG: polyprenyl synthetase family protein [Tibeticola sp.]|nr:polyprenyl synthetase family protein [Tibeticola sp.]MCI4440285.1 polyprenyl synthetase family protein [Tibeticola sp.]